MAHTFNRDGAAEYARRQTEQRIESFTGAASAFATVQEARAALDTAEAQYADAYKRASDAGWSRAELRGFNLTDPGKPRRKRSPRKTADAGSSTSPVTPDVASTPTP